MNELKMAMEAATPDKLTELLLEGKKKQPQKLHMDVALTI